MGVTFIFICLVFHFLGLSFCSWSEKVSASFLCGPTKYFVTPTTVELNWVVLGCDNIYFWCKGKMGIDMCWYPNEHYNYPWPGLTYHPILPALLIIAHILHNILQLVQLNRLYGIFILLPNITHIVTMFKTSGPFVLH